MTYFDPKVKIVIIPTRANAKRMSILHEDSKEMLF